MEFSREILDLASKALSAARAQGVRIATAESCTAGLIAGALTEIAGSSDVVDRGFVTYSNEAKMQMLGVSTASLDAFGAVSEPVAKEMAYGALANSMADITVAVTGIAGPGGGIADKPVGTVWFGICTAGQAPRAFKEQFGEDLSRQKIREKTVITALSEIVKEFS